MNEQAQRIAIAESMGIRCKVCNNTSIMPKFGQREWPEKEPDISCEHPGLPDYLNSLDAMHEVIMSQGWGDSEEAGFCLELDRICDPHGQDQFASVNATAKQRAEAYLRTIGKWKETIKAAA